MFVDLMPAIAYGFAAAVTPGPLLMFLLSQAVSHGWRRTLPAAFSPLITDGPVAVLVLAVLSQVPQILVNSLRLFGGAFILYLAFGAWKTWRAFDSGKPAAAESRPNSLLKAIVVNWLNPNLYLGWSLILGPVVLSGWHRSPAKGAALIAAFYVPLIVTMIVLVLVFAAARTFGPRLRKILIGCSSAALAVLGFYQLWLGASTVLILFNS
jgi:threonine/homoserine/homoserine lactone efflux protein